MDVGVLVALGVVVGDEGGRVVALGLGVGVLSADGTGGHGSDSPSPRSMALTVASIFHISAIGSLGDAWPLALTVIGVADTWRVGIGVKLATAVGDEVGATVGWTVGVSVAGTGVGGMGVGVAAHAPVSRLINNKPIPRESNFWRFISAS